MKESKKYITAAAGAVLALVVVMVYKKRQERNDEELDDICRMDCDNCEIKCSLKKEEKEVSESGFLKEFIEALPSSVRSEIEANGYSVSLDHERTQYTNEIIPTAIKIKKEETIMKIYETDEEKGVSDGIKDQDVFFKANTPRLSINVIPEIKMDANVYMNDNEFSRTILTSISYTIPLEITEGALKLTDKMAQKLAKEVSK